MKHTTTIVDNITNYKLVLMIVIFCETYNSDLINVPAQIVSHMREVYYFMKKTLSNSWKRNKKWKRY